MKANNEAERWLKQAEKDIEGKRYHLACFLSQQSAEKSLKAFLFAKKKSAWGHSVAELCEDCSTSDKDFKELKKKASLLDKFYIPTRYPNGLPGGIPSDAFNALDAKRAIEISDEILTVIEKK